MATMESTFLYVRKFIGKTLSVAPAPAPPKGGALCDIPGNSTFCVEGAGYGHAEKSSPFGGAGIAKR